MTDSSVPNLETLLQSWKDKPESMIKTLQSDPTIANWILSDATGEKKYIKLTENMQRSLDKAIKQFNMSESMLIGLAVLLVLLILGMTI